MTITKEDWPPKFEVTPEGAAALFLIAHCRGEQGSHAQDALAKLLKIYWQGGYNKAKEEQL